MCENSMCGQRQFEVCIAMVTPVSFWEAEEEQREMEFWRRNHPKENGRGEETRVMSQHESAIKI